MSFSAPPNIVESVEIAYGNTPDGDPFSVSLVRYDRRVRGAYDESCIVQFGRPDFVTESIGFASWEDAKRYLSSNKDEDYSAYDANGGEVKVRRMGRRIPPGMMVETLSADLNKPAESPVTERGRTDPFDADDHGYRDRVPYSGSNIQPADHATAPRSTPGAVESQNRGQHNEQREKSSGHAGSENPGPAENF